VVTRQLQVKCRTRKIRQSKTNVLPLRHATNSTWGRTLGSLTLICVAAAKANTGKNRLCHQLGYAKSVWAPFSHQMAGSFHGNQCKLNHDTFTLSYFTLIILVCDINSTRISSHYCYVPSTERTVTSRAVNLFVFHLQVDVVGPLLLNASLLLVLTTDYSD